MPWTLTTSGACLAKAGLKANISNGNLQGYSNQAEAVINTATRKDWVADYGNVTANFKAILDDTASDMVAMRIINFDMQALGSRATAETMLDVLRDNSVRNLEILKDEKNKEIMD